MIGGGYLSTDAVSFSNGPLGGRLCFLVVVSSPWRLALPWQLSSVGLPREDAHKLVSISEPGMERNYVESPPRVTAFLTSDGGRAFQEAVGSCVSSSVLA
jgi:hypothetical protein